MDLLEVTSWRSAREREDLRLAPGEQVVAGGTWLFSEQQPGTTGLVDLTSLGWRPWEVTGSGLSLAATCTVRELLAVPDDVLGTAAPLARQCADAFLMSFKIQHLATLGGNVCLALPAGAMTSLLVALDATAVVWGAEGEREEPVASLVTGVRRTTLAPGEVVRSFEVPREALRTAHGFRRQSLAPYGRSAVVVTASAERLCLTAATTRPVVLDPRGDWQRELDGLDCWHADAHGATDWRAAMARRLAAQALEELA